MKVAILEDLGVSDGALAALERPFADAGIVFSHFPRSGEPEEVIREARDAQAVILANMPFPDRVIRALPELQFIDVAFTGVDHVGLSAARERGIAVSNASGYSNEAVAELVLGTVLSMARNLRQVEDRCRAGGGKEGLIGWELMGKCVGIVGLGRIGRRTAELFHAFGARILAHSATRHADAPEYVEETTLAGLLHRADIVVLHCPMNDATRGLIGGAELQTMKPTALLVNAARGGVVDEAALIRALEEGTIAGACLDVFSTEPPLKPDAAILRAPNTLLTPHVAFATQESMARRAEIVFDNLGAWLAGERKNRVI